jgi:hypothetical protein
LNSRTSHGAVAARPSGGCDLGGDLFERLDPPSGQGDRRSQTCEAESHRATEAAAAPGDPGDLSL